LFKKVYLKLSGLIAFSSNTKKYLRNNPLSLRERVRVREFKIKSIHLKIAVVIFLTSAFQQASAQITIQDELKNQITLDHPVKSIITLSPHLTELVFEAGAGHLISATVDHADYPEQAKTISSLGAYNHWDIEQVLLLKPDIVLAWQTANGDEPINKLRQLGIKVYVSEPRKIEDIALTIKNIGLMAGTTDVADKTANTFIQSMQQLGDQYAEQKPVKVFYQVWSNPLVTVNGEQLISALIRMCGGKNVFADIDNLAPTIGQEDLIDANPQIIIGGARHGEHDNWLAEWRQWSSIDAVQYEQLYFIHPDLLNRQTTRMLQGAQQLCTYIDNARQLSND